jgi:gamma-glutamylcyclotransferase (GGCT)/AIG2-like uncharacterized protein YtfP
MLQESLDLLAKFSELTSLDRWHLPFPMGVFGTLRENQYNNHRMHRGDIALHRKAFMPHFIAHGLSINYSKDSSAPFEVFFYKPDQWSKMIPGVDSLEGFRPDNVDDPWSVRYGYFRTLAWLRLLPADFDHSLFEPKRLGDLPRSRNLNIPTDQWDNYERVPCWVYSSRHQNEAAANSGTVIWG